ncbi:hypothetical protein GCM10022377_17370 [Zhihengliuella alba]|uniref:HTH marR-type domain-containing protein n=1 Tax=Zhihengliuella alba TaxID=547018 RepID=A0ABP7DJN2_9MICC
MEHDHDPADLGHLMHAAFRRLRGTWTEQLAPWGLTPFQWRALNVLVRQQDRPVRQQDRPVPQQDRGDGPEGPACMRPKDLAARLRIAARTATEVVDQLEGKGLVARRPDPADRRAVLVALTADGLGLARSIHEERRRLSDEYFSVLPAEDRAELARILHRLAAAED